MKKFLIKILLFLIPLFIVSLFLEYSIRQIPNNYSLKKEYLDNFSNDIEVLILGSSHTYYGLNPVFFSHKTFNAANISQTLNYDYTIIKTYENNFKKLKAIILPISYFTYFTNLNEGPESWREKNYVLYFDTKSFSISRNMEILSEPLRIGVKKIFNFYIKKESLITSSNLGWGTDYLSIKAKDLKKTGKLAAKNHSFNILSNQVKEISLENKIFIDEIIEWTTKNNIQVFFVFPPANKNYRQSIDKMQLEHTIKITNDYSKNNKNIHFINLFNNNYFIDSDYFDADHLSGEGAKKFSIIMNENIKKHIN